MMDNRSSSSRVPPGFRFHPTDVELVGYYLRKKVASQKIDLDVIPDIDLYRIEPWDLQDKCGMGYEVQKNEWYFFSYKDKKYPTGTRTNRATMAGFWKATGRDKAVYDRSNLIIGMRKTLVFYKGRAPSGLKTDWIMHEYRLQSQDQNLPPQEEGWVVCRAFKKRFLTTTGQTKRSIESLDSTYYDYDEPISSDAIHNKTATQQAVNFVSMKNMACKKDAEYFVQSEEFVQQLPQLESPSLMRKPTKRRNPVSIATGINNYNNGHEEEDDRCVMGSSSKVLRDWRDLDKLVASQLSHGDPYTWVDVGTGFQSHGDYSDLLQRAKEEEEGPGLNDISTSDCDFGICIFNK